MKEKYQNQESVKPIDLTGVLRSYVNRWVALSPDQTRVKGSGPSPSEALADAKSHGEADPILLFVPAVSGAYVLRQ